MLKQWQFMLLTALAVVSLALVAVDIVLVSGNREVQTEVASRAQYIQQSAQLEPLYQGIVRNLAELSTKSKDPQIEQLLSSLGITFTVNPPSPTEAPKAEAKGAGK